MLAEAQARFQKHGWRNVELVQADVSQFAFPQGVDGVFSSFALSIMPNHRDISGTKITEEGDSHEAE